MYHRIADEPFDPWGTAVSPSNFESQVRWLSQHRTVLALQEFARLHREGSLPPDAVALTFDDGYACNAHTAAPILHELGLPATMFLPAELVAAGAPYWWDLLKVLVLEQPATTITLLGHEVQLGPREAGDARWQANPKRQTARHKAFYATWSRLRLVSAAARAEALNSLERGLKNPSAENAVPVLMSADDARSLASRGIEIGSHGMTHAHLPSLDSEAKRQEIVESLSAIEGITGVTPHSFCYPFGEFDGESVALVAAAGFACACTVGHKLVEPGDSPFALPRLHVWNRDSSWLRQQLASPAA